MLGGLAWGNWDVFGRVFLVFTILISFVVGISSGAVGRWGG